MHLNNNNKSGYNNTKQILVGKDLPIKLSMNKLNLIKPGFNFGANKFKNKRQQQQ